LRDGKRYRHDPNDRRIAALIVGVIVLTIILIALIGGGSATRQTAVTNPTAVNDPTDPRYWTPERIAVSRTRADAAAHGKVLIGMYAPDCEKAWGKPERVERTTTANGVSEWWWYGGGRALHLEKGVLVSIHE
jgi:hypothetical protein